MSLITISVQVYKWLQTLNLVKEGKKSQENKIQLPKEISQKFMIGSTFASIIKTICKNENNYKQIIYNLETLRQNISPSIRLYNWNILIQSLKKIGIIINAEMKKSILELNQAVVIEILEKIYEKYVPKSIQKNIKPLQVDLANISIQKPLNQSVNILEFTVITLSRTLKLSPQHALNLFLDNNKYLAHLLVKGVKGSYDPILSFIEDVKQNIEFIIMNLFIHEQKQSVQFLFNVIKAGLISKDETVAIKTYQLFSLFYQTYEVKQLQYKTVREWIIKEGINTFLYCIKRHQILTRDIIVLMLQFLKSQFFQFVSPNSKNSLWINNKELLTFFILFLESLSQPYLSSFQISNQIKQWISLLLKLINNNEIDRGIKMKCLSILKKIWTLMPKFFQENQKELPNMFINTLKNYSLENDEIFSNACIIMLFDLKIKLGTERNTFAPYIYKTLINIFDFSGNYDKIVFMIQNFIYSFKQLVNLPASPLMASLIKLMQNGINIQILELCKIMIELNRLTTLQIMQIIDILSKTVLNNLIYSNLAYEILIDSLNTLDSDIQLQEFCINICKFALSMFYAHQKNTRSLVVIQKQYEKYKQKLSKSTLQEIKLYANMKNISKLIQLFLTRYLNIHQKMELFISHTYIQIKKQVNKQSKILLKLLKIILKTDEKVLESIRSHDKNDNQNKVNDKNNISSDNNMVNDKNNVINDKNIQIKENNTPISRRDRVKSMMNSRVEKNLESSAQIDLHYLNPSIGIRNRESLGSRYDELVSLDVTTLKPTKRALRNLEQTKLKRQQLRLRSEENHLRNKSLIQKKSKIIKNLMQIRHIQFGISKQKDQEVNCIYDWETVKQQTANQIGIPNINFFQLQQDQDFSIESIESYMKKFRKVWRFLFFKYSSGGIKNKQALASFKSEEKINIAEIWKMIRDYQVANIKKQQLQTLIRIINQHAGNRSDMYNLSYSGFQQFIFQFCVFVYSKPQKGLYHVPLIRHLQQFINQLKVITSLNNGKIQIFQNPENAYFQEGQVIQEFNKRLMQNSKFILPEGYKKIKEVQIDFEYKLKKYQPIAQKYEIVFQIFNQIFYNIFEVNILEPQTCKTESFRAKPVLFQNLAQKLKNYKQGYLLPKKNTLSNQKSKEKIVYIDKNQFHPLVKFSLGIKLGISCVNVKDKFIAQQVAYWMDDMLDAVENQQTYVGNKSKRMIQNQYLRNKKLQQQMQKKLIMQQEKKTNHRQVQMKIRLKKQKQQLEEKKKQQQNKKQIQKSIQLKKKKQKQQQYKKIREILIKKREQDLIQKEKKEKQQKQKLKIQKQQYKKSVDQYFEKKKIEVKTLVEQNKKKRDQQMLKQQQYQKQSIEKQNQLYINILKKDQNIISKAVNKKSDYNDIWLSTPIKKMNQKYQFQLKMLFDLLLKYQKSKISSTNKDQISQVTFNLFALKFKLMPFLINKNVLIIIFNSLLKEESKKIALGLDFQKFKEAMFKICVKSKKILNNFIQNKNSSQTLLNKQEQSQQNNTSLKHSPKKIKVQLSEQYLFDPADVDQSTLQQLYEFLQMADDKQSMEIRFRDALQSKSKPTSVLIKQLKNYKNDSKQITDR